MYDLYNEDLEWKESQNGNYCCIQCGDLIATVFENKYGVWQIIVKGEYLDNIVANEYFEDSDDGISRAEEILHGAECELKPLKPKPY